MQQRRLNTRGIVYRDGKILAVKLKDQDGSPVGYWCLPGGGVDDYESVEDAVKREFQEEIGVTPTIDRIILGQQYRTSREGFNEELELFYLLKDSPEYDAIDLSKTSHGMEEIYEVAFIDPKTEHLLPRFLREIDLSRYAEEVKPLYIVNNFDEPSTGKK